MENGIATGFFDPEGVAAGIVMGLRIVGNEIVGCVSETIAPRGSDQPFGGVILGRAYDLEIHDNRIERNGEQARVAICGIHVRQSRGVQISGNVLRDNGRLPDGELLPGPQAGISLRNASVMVVPAPTARNTDGFRLSPVPAPRIAATTVASRTRPALWISGMGPHRRRVLSGNRV